MATRGTQGAVSLSRRARTGDNGRGEARANRIARDPAGVAGCPDLAAPDREAAGDRSRLRWTAPVPLPSGIPRRPGAGEVRQADSLRRAPPGPARGNGRAHGARVARLRSD